MVHSRARVRDLGGGAGLGLLGLRLEDELPKLAAVDWRWVTFAMAADIATYFFQGWRWSLLLRPIAPARILRSVQAIFVGLFANSVLPLRTGELLRTYLQARWVEIPVSVCLSSVLIERLLDGILLVLGFYAVTYFVEVPGYLRDASLVLAVVVGVLSVLLGIVMFHKHHAHAAVSRSRWADDAVARGGGAARDGELSDVHSEPRRSACCTWPRSSSRSTPWAGVSAWKSPWAPPPSCW